MLTGDLIHPRLRKRGSELHVEWLTTDKHWQKSSSDLIRLFGKQVGQPRQVWDAALERYEGERTDYIVLRGLAKVLFQCLEF